jgi:Domain of unknown function (DUF4407)
VPHTTPYYEKALDGPAGQNAESPLNAEPADDLIRDDERARNPSRLGNFVIFLTSADRTRIGSYSERQRYITIGLLMMVTAAQAFYAACLLASVGFKRPFDQVIGFGVFFAAAVLLIDRSIIGYVPPARFDGLGRPRPPRRFTPIIVARLMIALAAAVLMSEMVLLQFFASDINAQIQSDHLAAAQQANTQVTRLYQTQITILQDQINAAQRVVNERQTAYSNAQKQANCQEFGCSGITAGRGPGFTAAEKSLTDALAALTTAQHNLQTVTAANTSRISQLNAERHAEITSSQQTINQANALLTREEAFWQLTVRHGTVAFWRIVLTLLILGIDLAPLLTKLTGKTTVHDTLIRNEEYVANELDHERARTIKLANAGRQRLQRERDSADIETKTRQLVADTEVTRLGITLSADLSKQQLHHFYTAG